MNYLRLSIKVVAASVVGNLVHWSIINSVADNGELIAPVAALVAWVSVFILLFPNDLVLEGRSNVLAVRAMLLILVFFGVCVFLALFLLK